MEFIVDNYIWFIVGGIILFMTLIGFIADKTNYIENQKNQDKKKKETIDKKKKEPISRSREKFSKEIGDGKNLVLTENDIVYPVELDRPAVAIEIPALEPVQEEPKDKKKKKKEKKKKHDKQQEFIEDLNLEGLSLNGEPVPEPTPAINDLGINNEVGTVSYNYNGANDGMDQLDPSLTAPLEDGVLHLDAYDSKPETPTVSDIPVSSTEISEPVLEPEMNAPKEIEPEIKIENAEVTENTPVDTPVPPVTEVSDVEQIVPDFPNVKADDLVEVPTLPDEMPTENGTEQPAQVNITEPSIAPKEENTVENVPEPTLDTLNQNQTDDDVWKF